MHKITPFLWFEKEAKKIAEFYLSVFKEGSIKRVQTMEGTPSGNVEIVELELAGQPLTIMSAGPQFRLNEAFSLVIDCKDQAEVDYYWEALTADGGEESMCGWVKDKYGLSWQIVPRRLNELMNDPDKDKANRVIQAMLQMKKIIVADLEKAYRGE
jgi:predicted 3-demethylubiquinone-9 3-methyltransferase (glyoxalase superfamily)